MSGGDWKTMFKAIQENDLELVSFYLRLGMDPNYQHPEVLALPLSECIRYNHLDIAQLLLENGAQTSIKETETRMTSLELALHLKNQNATDLLKRYSK